MPTSNAKASWEGGLRDGKGSFSSRSGAIGGSFNFGSRFGGEQGTNPEELLAAAEAACFSMALSGGLEAGGTPPRSVNTEAACTVEKVGDGFTITTIRLTVRADVPGIDAETFQKALQDTKVGCPVSRALTGVDIQVEGSLV